jgi:hypothetical protein
MSVFLRPITDLEAALRLRTSTERRAAARWDDPEYRKYADRAIARLDQEHRRFLAELATLDETVRSALDQLKG